MRKLLVSIVFGVATSVGAAAPVKIEPAAAKVFEDFVSAKPAENLPVNIAIALAGIKAPALAAHIGFLASPALQGRGLPSDGLDAAAEYAATSLALAGVPPLVGCESEKSAVATYFQVVHLREISGFGSELGVVLKQGGGVQNRTYISGADFLLPELSPRTITAPVVFAGFGIREPALGHDDLQGVDVRGKVALILGGVPAGEKWQKPELLTRYDAPTARTRYAAKINALAGLGAVAVLVVEEGDFAPQLGKDAPEKRFFLPFDAVAASEGPPLVRVSRAISNALGVTAGVGSEKARSAASCDLPGAVVTITWNGTERVVTSRNVVGVIRGTDPKLSEHAVIIGAHLDHLGQKDGGYYPGADDNASGVAALVEIARVWSASPIKPKRSVVFVFWTGEEEGKLGSGYWVRHPLWPLSQTVAYLNLDMIAHPWSMDEIVKLVKETGFTNGEAFLKEVNPTDFIEPGVADWAPELGVALGRAARGTGLTLHLDRSAGTQGGSDYRDFARAHVPWIRFFGNYFPAYHEFGDTPDTVDRTQVEKMARLALATALLLADQ